MLENKQNASIRLSFLQVYNNTRVVFEGQTTVVNIDKWARNIIVHHANHSELLYVTKYWIWDRNIVLAFLERVEPSLLLRLVSIERHQLYPPEKTSMIASQTPWLVS